MAYTIIEVERRLGVPSRTLRFWATKGLFDAVHRDKNGVLYFSEKDLEQVIWVEALRKGGMSIERVREYLQSYELEASAAVLQKRQDMIADQLDLVCEELEHLSKVKAMLEGKLAFLKEYKRLGKRPEGFSCEAFEELRARIKKAVRVR